MSRRQINKALQKLAASSDPNNGLVGREIRSGQFSFVQSVDIYRFVRDNGQLDPTNDSSSLALSKSGVGSGSSPSGTGSGIGGSGSTSGGIFFGYRSIGSGSVINAHGLRPTPGPSGSGTGSGTSGAYTVGYEGLYIWEKGPWMSYGYISVNGAANAFYKTEITINNVVVPNTECWTKAWGNGYAYVPVGGVFNIPQGGATWNILITSNTAGQFTAIGANELNGAPHLNVSLIKIPGDSFEFNV